MSQLAEMLGEDDLLQDLMDNVHNEEDLLRIAENNRLVKIRLVITKSPFEGFLFYAGSNAEANWTIILRMVLTTTAPDCARSGLPPKRLAAEIACIMTACRLTTLLAEKYASAALRRSLESNHGATLIEL